LKFQSKKSKRNKAKKRGNKPVHKWFYVILFLTPIIFFILLEISLRFFNYGFDTTQWIPATEDKLYLNPNIARRYFHTTQRIPYSNQDFFDAEKKQNAFRVFVMGGSSAAGYPYSPLGSFSRYLRKRLEILYPSSVIEVVNIGLTAVNSYTIRDLLPGVLEQKPDLILIYAGHNEYYGALGIGSMESLGTSRDMVNLILYLNKYKTVELLRNTIRWIGKMFAGESDEYKSGTLMSRIAKDQYISLDSETYYKGIAQFEGNMRDIMKMAEEKNVPVILSTLVSNLKDQPPFVSLKSENLPEADVVYSDAKNKLSSGDYSEADSLFRFAKDLDALRFRAPEELNRVIKSLGEEFHLPVINIDSVFASISPDGITGNNIMTDHLHPTLDGYRLIGRVFFDKMKENKFLPSSEPLNLSDEEQDSITVTDFHFTELDSVLADFRIRILKNDWPFVEKEKQQPYSVLLKPENIIDSIAFEILSDEIIWEAGHRKLAAYYLEKKNISSFLKEMDALIYQYPVVIEYYEFVSNVLIPLRDYHRAYRYVETGYKIKPTAFTSKWLGTINLYNNNLPVAEKYLKESLTYDNTDAQTWYNLAGVYVNKNEYKMALETVNKAVSLKPGYAEALSLQQQLQNAVK
jgi:tetratricopeptide (TPR) repeat protein